MVGWHQWLDGHKFEQAPGVGDGQGILACCSPWGHKESDTTEQLNWTEHSREPACWGNLSSNVSLRLFDSWVTWSSLCPATQKIRYLWKNLFSFSFLRGEIQIHCQGVPRKTLPLNSFHQANRTVAQTPQWLFQASPVIDKSLIS